jgi:tetratricopeptide (TPR) repeat protein
MPPEHYEEACMPGFARESLRTVLGFALTLSVFASSAFTETPAQQKAKAQKLYVQALGQEKEQKFADAAATMAQAIELQPMNDAYLGYTAQLYSKAGKYREAIDHAQQAIKLKPKVPAYYGIAMMCGYESQDYETARENATKVMEFGARAGPANLESARIILAYLSLRKGDPDFRAIDKHALKASELHEDSIDSLAEYLVRPAKTDLEKTRAIFRWITDRIAYNAEGFFKKEYGDNSPASVLKTRKAVCQGYSELFQAIGKKAGLDVVVVSGDAKSPFGGGLGHAWTAVKIDDKYRLLDSTWGAGYVDGKTQSFRKEFKEYYFLTPAENLILSHMPKDPKWQLLDKPVTGEEFSKWRDVGGPLLMAGANPIDIRNQLSAKPDFEFVNTYTMAGTRVVLKKVPLQKKLAPGAQSFQLEAYGFKELVFIHNKKFTPLARNGSVFHGQLPVQVGELKISGKKLSGGSYWTILEYHVE